MAEVSIIIPVYKVEEYVGKAIESILNQTFQDWELFCVDDGSPDKSGEICDRYAAQDPRIRVIHQANAGAAAARNVAIEQAGGNYLYFMDADDWAEPEMLSDMVAAAKEHKTQLLIAGYYIETYYSDTEFYLQKQSAPSKYYESRRAFRQDAHTLFDRNLLYTPWNKLYEAAYIKENNIRFPKTHWDDFPFNLLVVRDVERVAVTEKGYYHFLRKRAESESEKYNPGLYAKREEENGWLLELYDYWNKTEREADPQAPAFPSDDDREFIARRYVERIVGCVENVTNRNCTLTKSEKKEEIRRIISLNTVKEALKIAKPRSRYMKIMLSPIRKGNVNLTYLEGKIISFIKRKNVKLFARLKANR